jgi:hypothetical protein
VFVVCCLVLSKSMYAINCHFFSRNLEIRL